MGWTGERCQTRALAVVINAFVDAGKAGMDRSLPGPDGGLSQTERRLRSECKELKLALAEATVQLRIWQKGSEYIDSVPSPTSRP